MVSYRIENGRLKEVVGHRSNVRFHLPRRLSVRTLFPDRSTTDIRITRGG